MEYVAAKMASIAYSLVWVEFSVWWPPSEADTGATVNGECYFEGEDLTEQCAMRYTDYRLKIKRANGVKSGLWEWMHGVGIAISIPIICYFHSPLQLHHHYSL